MKNNIHYSPESQSDLDEIWEYISFVLCNSQAAENTINNILNAVDELQNFSEIGAPLSSVTGIESDYRFLGQRQLHDFLSRNQAKHLH